MRIFLALAILCLVQPAFSQPAPIRFSGEALSIAMSDGNELAAISTRDSIFIYRLPEMTLYKKTGHTLVFPTIIGFAASSFAKPDMNDVLIIRENNFTLSPPAYNLSLWADLEKYQRSQFGEKPHDSVSLWSISQAKSINKVPGNYYFDFFTFREMGVFALNHISKAYVGMDGDSVFSSRQASIFSRWDTDKTYESQLNGVVKKLLTSPVNLSFTLITQDPGSGKYKVSVRKVETHQVIFESEELDQLPLQLAYSQDGKQVLFSQNPSFRKSDIYVIDIRSKKIAQTVAVADDLLGAAFINYDSAIGYATPSNWVKWNLQDRRIEKEISGTAFFSGFKLLNALASQDFLLVHTQAMSNLGMGLGQSEIRLSAINDFAVFADVQKGGEETILLPDEFTMQLNDLPDFASDIVFNAAKTHFTLLGNNNNRLQVWETKSRRKIFDKYFTDDVQGFIDASGRYLFVIEYKDGDARRFRLRHIDLKTGKMISTDQQTVVEGAFKNNGNKVSAVALKDEANAWYINDQDNAIWKFTGSNFVPEKYEFNSPGFNTVRNIALDNDGNLFANIYNKNQVRDILSINFKQRSFVKLAEGNYSTPKPYKDGYLMMAEKEVLYFNNGKQEKSFPLDGKLVRVATAENADKFWVQLIRANGEHAVAAVDFNGEIKYKKMKEAAMDLQLLNNGQLVYFRDGIKTYVDENADPILWNTVVSKEYYLEEPSVSPTGRYVLKSQVIIDLKEANRTPIGKYVHSLFVPGKTELDRIELFSKGWDQDKYFSIRRISGTDTTVSATSIKIPESSTIGFDHNKLYLSPDEKWLVTYANLSIDNGKRAGPMIWNLESLQGFPFPQQFGEYIPFFSSQAGSVFMRDEISYNQETMNSLFDLTEFSLDPAKGPVQVKKSKKQHDLLLPGKYNFEVPEFNSIDWKEENSSKNKKQFFSKQSMHSYAFSPTHQLLFGGTAEGVLHTWDINGASSPISSLQVTNDQINFIKIRGDRVYIFSTTANLAIYSITQKKLLANLQFIQKEGEQKIAMYTPDKYFNLDPEAMDALHFIKRGSVFPLSSYELQGNRPDKVYASLGFADKTYLEVLKKGWQTRLKRVGVQPTETFLQTSGPAVSWDRDVLPLFSTERNLALRLSAVDTTGNFLTKLLITINGVPLRSKAGIAINGAQKEFQFSETVPLSVGKNNISVVAINNKGNESVEQMHEIVYAPQPKPAGKIVFIGIGVSTYKDTTKNLVYAAKDVKDISNRLKYFADSVQTLTLTNAEATRQNIAGLKSVLSKTATDDVVILSFSGHGMIDSATGFLFAPHDMDFERPAQQGVSMNMIEELMDNIPARKKLLLMDACHSGEQLEGLSASASLPTGVKEINTKGVDKIKKKQDQEQESQRKGYMAMKELFGDFSRGNGAFMISAAASNEFALESKQWNNGVFTASFLEALYELKEKTTDRTIKVRELRKAIYEKVNQRTRGQQTPTSRQENGWWNWSF
jgi:hypothetical protein